MNPLLFHKLFADWNETEGLVKLGIGDYLLLLQLVAHKNKALQSFDDFVFACETLWLKRVEQREAFHKLFEQRREGIEEMIAYLNAQVNEAVPKFEAAAAEKAVAAPDAPNPTAETEAGNPANSVNQNKQEENTKEKAPENQPEGEITITLELSGAEQDGFETAQRFTVSEDYVLLSPSKRYLFGTEYFPVSNRVLQQSWRSLYNNHDVQGLGEVDMPDTIKRICREGRFIDFAYRPEQANLLSLFIFIDQGGSMTACEEFGKELVKSALESEVHANVRPYFFWNVPVALDDGSNVYAVYNEQRTEAFHTTDLFKGLRKKNIVLLLYSDAGAINGNADSGRIEATAEFLKAMVRRTAFAAWLNPAPEHRWAGTGAGKIALAVPEVGMYEASRNGLNQAIEALKGKLTQSIKNQHAAAAS